MQKKERGPSNKRQYTLIVSIALVILTVTILYLRNNDSFISPPSSAKPLFSAAPLSSATYVVGVNTPTDNIPGSTGFWVKHGSDGEVTRSTADIYADDDIQTALDNLPSSGGTVILLPGIYLINSGIVIQKSQVRFESLGEIYEEEDTNLPAAITVGDGTNSYRDIIVNITKIDGNRDKQSQDPAVFPQVLVAMKITNLQVNIAAYNFRGGVVFSDVSYSSLKGYGYNLGCDNFAFIDTTYSTMDIVSEKSYRDAGSIFRGGYNTARVVAQTEDNNGFIISDGTLEGFGSGPNLGHNQVFLVGKGKNGPSIDNIGLWIYGSNDNYANIDIDGYYYGVRLENSNRNVVTGSIRGTVLEGAQTQYQVLITGTSTENTIDTLKVANYYRSAIQIDSTAAGNIIQNSLLIPSGGTLRTGVRVNAPGTIVRNNTIILESTEDNLYGITLAATSSDCIIEENYITDISTPSRNLGILDAGSNNKIQNNTDLITKTKVQLLSEPWKPRQPQTIE